MKSLEKNVGRVARVCIFLLPFIVLYVAESLFFPFITGKNFAFRVLVEIAVCSWLSLAIIAPHYRPRRSIVLLSLGVFVVAMAVANALGVNPYKSFMSNFERMDGWITIAHVFALTAVMSAMMRTEKIWRRFWHISLGVAWIVSLYGFLQIANVMALGQGSGSGLSVRIDATFGNAIYLAVYMLFNIFLAVLLIFQEGRERWTGGERIAGIGASGLVVLMVAVSLLSKGVPASATALIVGGVFAFISSLLLFLEKRYIFAFVAIIGTMILFLTGTRGTMIGIIGGSFIAVATYWWQRRDSERVRRFALATLIIAMFAGTIFFAVRNEPWVRNIGFMDRLASISLRDNTIKARFYNWNIAWQGVKEHPVLGWGQENYAVVFDKYYDPRMYAQEPWFDRVHNIIFDWLVAGGIVGLLSYLGIFVATLWVLWRSSTFVAYERSVFTGLLSGYFFHNLFVFDNVTSYILWSSVLAYIIYRETESRSSQVIMQKVALHRVALPAVAVGGLCVTVLVVFMVNGPAYAQNKMLIRSLITRESDPIARLRYMEDALRFDSLGTQEAREQLIQSASQMAGTKAQDDIKSRFMSFAISEMNLQKLQSPLDARFPLFLGVLYSSYGAYDQAEIAFKNAHELSPKKQNILLQMATIADIRGHGAESVEYAKQAFELLPANIDARFTYALYLSKNGYYAQASRLLSEADGVDDLAQDKMLAGYVAVAEVMIKEGKSREAYAMLNEFGNKYPREKNNVEEIIKLLKDNKGKNIFGR